MMAARHLPGLADCLRGVRGRVQSDAAIGAQTWFRVGGPAAMLVRPADADDVAAVLAAIPPNERITVLGAASNVIVRDGGLPGITLRLGRGLAEVAVEADGIVAGAAALDATVAEHAAAAGLGGLEFLSGIPGSIGGAVAMNAGAYGSDIAACLDWVDVATRAGAIVRLAARELALSYRHASLPPGGVVVRARLRGHKAEPALIAYRMAQIRSRRTATQPVRARTGGSTFANPAHGSLKAWELIDAAGARGLVRGGAMVSELHCNFLLNTGTASAADLESLGEDVRRRVHAATGITLEWEIRRLGIPAGRPVAVA